MNVFATFRHSMYLEMAIIELEQRGIEQQNILVIPLDNQYTKSHDIVLTHRGDPIGIQFGFIFGTVFMLLGVIYGFVFKWGPVLWGMIGILTGGVLGYWLDLFLIKRNQNTIGLSEVILIVDCHQSMSSEVERILWGHRAVGVAKLQPKTS
ncbi:hypothetical protein AAC03nite_12680 [Alicyclobacillus acidoterrestris]|uniref:hypothetical protein n=1 Tax=Alicyclobacillus suci TaxID=2816080 RepID=UPI00119038DB|nr:hypothetical protein [Alicyclobacillus suci]GEO25483.1 hypothetical protein AAC03nite_12680 [Alicyclobacillus acidoterrestris]